ncbi:MAG TPA: type II toxin-antitoxin system VapC family toxin [Candidatus Nanoarchaeia archaeon]|nr:type II toxin-antitoxin system VapC family toxin [Candidatus Nanoarchaeia archaeon]
MTLVFDTSILIDLERKSVNTIQKLKTLSKNYPLPVQIAFMTEFEFLLGIKEKNPKNKEKAKLFLSLFPVLHSNSRTADLMAELKHKYDAKGIPITLADLLIATICIQENKTVVTKDKNFNNIEELSKIIID